MANVKYKYLGYGITNNNGVATLDYDANGDPLQNSGLVGNGAGKLDIVGSLDDLSNIRINYSPSTITDTGGTYTLSATVTNNNVAVNGETVCFNLYKVSDGSLVDTVTGVTNSSGVATVSYVGKGTGDLYIKCECLERIIQSETFVTYDCIFADDGIVNPNTNWDCLLVTRSEESNGTKFFVTTESASARASMNPLDNSSAYDFDAQPMAFEFDVVDLNVGNGAIQAQFLQSTPSTLNKSFNLKSSYIGHTVKITYDGSALKLFVDGEQDYSSIGVTYDTSNKMRVGFAMYKQNQYIIVKNVKAYPI